MKPALILWEDAGVVDNTNWVDHDEYTWQPIIIKTCAIVLYDGPEGMVVTHSVGEGSVTFTRLQIPRGMIKEVIWLTEPNSWMEAVSE